MQNATTQASSNLPVNLRNTIAGKLRQSSKKLMNNVELGDTIGGATVVATLTVLLILLVTEGVGQMPTAIGITALLCGGGTLYFARVAKRMFNYFRSPINELLAELEKYSQQHDEVIDLLERRIPEFKAKGGRFLSSILTERTLKDNRRRWTQLASTDYAAQLAGKSRRARKLIIEEIKQTIWEVRKMREAITQRPLTDRLIVERRWQFILQKTQRTRKAS